MEVPIPLRLRKEPLLEAAWEVRFTGKRASVGDVLPGIVFKELGGKYPEAVRLGAAEIPRVVAEQDPKLRYVPRIRLEGDNQSIQIGEQVVSLSCRRPYPGWCEFSASIRELIGILRASELIGAVQRFSLRYIDLIELGDPPSLDWLVLHVQLGQRAVTSQPVQLRTEIREDELLHIVQIITPAEVSIPGQDRRMRGVLVDIDSIWALKPTESWNAIVDRLDSVHSSSKRLFFELLTKDALSRLEPEYETSQP